MPNKITFDRELREHAEQIDHELLAFGYEHHKGAKLLIHRSVPRGVGAKLVHFCLLVGRDTDPAEAFAKIFGPAEQKSPVAQQTYQVEILGPDGVVHYRRPHDHKDVAEALGTHSYSVLFPGMCNIALAQELLGVDPAVNPIEIREEGTRVLSSKR